MRRSTKRLAVFGLALPVFLVLIAILYKLGMHQFEGRDRSFLRALEWAAETMTTTGYGQDSEWSHPVMVVFVAATQFFGVAAALLIFPIFVIPFFEERFEGRLPKTLPELKNTVLIYRFGPAVESLVEALERDKIKLVILEEDEDVARRLNERGRQVVFASLEDEDPDFAKISRARAVVAAGADHDNAVLTLTARQNGFEGPIIALTENPARRNPMLAAGATAAFTPLHVLAAAIAARASTKISPRVSGALSLGELEIREVRIDESSELAGASLASAKLRTRTGVTIIGRWKNGVLTSDLGPDESIEIGSILVAVGSGESLDALSELATPVTREGAFIVIGYGQLGHKVVEFLQLAGEEVLVIHESPGDGVDVVGDPMDPAVIERAGVDEAQAVVLALESDNATLFCAAVIRDLAAQISIVASVRRVENVSRIRRAGADFALSLGQVAGELLAFQVLGEKSVQLEPQIRVVKSSVGDLAGTSLADSRIRERTGCSVIGVERDGDIKLSLAADFTFKTDDDIYLSGTSDAVSRFFDTFPNTR